MPKNRWLSELNEILSSPESIEAAQSEGRLERSEKDVDELLDEFVPDAAVCGSGEGRVFLLTKPNGAQAVICGDPSGGSWILRRAEGAPAPEPGPEIEDDES